MSKTIQAVREFWEANPLWTGESNYEQGTREFFEEHRQVYLNDCLAGMLDERLFPKEQNRRRVLDLGCGPGFWTVELSSHGCADLTSVDLTNHALRLARQRCSLFDRRSKFVQQNAEQLAFRDEIFSHVNCQGVIHHTPDMSACLREIARVLEENGTASLSVYYRNVFLRTWRYWSWLGGWISRFGGKLDGRGRENIFLEKDPQKMVRLFDGKDNPIGKCFSKREFLERLSPFFDVVELFFHSFPARTLPFRLPRWLHRFLDRQVGFLIHVTVRKRRDA